MILFVGDLERVRDFSTSNTDLTARRLGMHKEQRKDRHRTADPNWPRDVPQHAGSCGTIKWES